MVVMAEVCAGWMDGGFVGRHLNFSAGAAQESLLAVVTPVSVKYIYKENWEMAGQRGSCLRQGKIEWADMEVRKSNMHFKNY